MSQLARIKENIDWRNNNIIKETYATHLAFDSIEQIIDSEETKLNDYILDNITADEKFQIICRAKDFDIEEIGQEIYNIIENSDFGDKREYIGICEYEDENINRYDVYCLNIDEYLLDTKDKWIKQDMNDYPNLTYEEAEFFEWELYVLGDEFNDIQKEFIQLALQCGVKRIILKWI